MAEVILIVEDDPQIVELIKIILETKQYDIHWAKDGEEAMKVAKELRPDLILLDIMMPKLNGYEVMHLLKENMELKDIPTIFLTAKSQTDDKVLGLKMGSHDYITKPFDIYELIARVEAALRIKSVVGPFRKSDRRAKDLLLADPITGLYSQTYLIERINEEIQRAKRHHYPIACMILDIDDFHTLITKYGELQSNQIKQQLALLLKNSNRVVDVIGRFGNDQFVAFLTQTDFGGLKVFGERLKEKIERSRLVNVDPQFQITVSIGGIAIYNDDELSAEIILEKSEKVLAKAKQQGKNRIVVEEMAVSE